VTIYLNADREIPLSWPHLATRRYRGACGRRSAASLSGISTTVAITPRFPRGAVSSGTPPMGNRERGLPGESNIPEWPPIGFLVGRFRAIGYLCERIAMAWMADFSIAKTMIL
jgi:hypothetical protein